VSTSVLGIRRQYHHTTLPSEFAPWFALHYPHSTFNGRFHLGFRREGSTGIWPLFNGSRDKLEEFLESMHVSSRLDYYITANAVTGRERKAKNLFSLHNIVVDIDAHGESGPLDPDLAQDLLWRLDRDLFSILSPPPPSSIIYTGRGIQLWWAIVPIAAKCLPWYQEIQDMFVLAISDCLAEYLQFESLHIDGQASGNVVGYFRLPCSINVHAGVDAKILSLTQSVYDTYDLINWAKKWQEENIQPAASVEPQDFSGQYSDTEICMLRDIYTMSFFRFKQITNLRRLRDRDIGDESRDKMNFMVYNSLLPSLGHDKAWDKLLLFNQGFKQPMTEQELHQTIDTAHRKGGYRYTNEKLIKFLDVTAKEQEAIGLYIPTIPYSPLSRLSNHPSRRAARKMVRDDRDKRVRQMREAGISRREISRQTGLAFRTVQSILGPEDTVEKEKKQGTTKQALVEEMLRTGKSTAEIKKELGVSVRTIQRAAKALREQSVLPGSPT